MPQGVLGFQYEADKSGAGSTALAGLPVYLDLAQVLGLRSSVERHLHARPVQGWGDADAVMALILLNVAGGDCVEDLDGLNADEGFAHLLVRLRLSGLPRAERRALARRWRRERTRAVPSTSSARRYLEEFDDPAQEEARRLSSVKAFIPAPNAHLQAFPKVNQDFLAAVQARSPEKDATLDQDATLLMCHKEAAYRSYKGPKAYQPLNTWWAEQGVLVHTEFRDGNVPAGYEQLRVFKEALALLPEGVERVWLRSDTAGYQHDLLEYCERGLNERFGRIRFAVGCDVSPEFKQAVAAVAEDDWHPICEVEDGKLVPSGQEWAEVCFVPEEIGRSKNAPEYRYLATREAIDEQQHLPGLDAQQHLPFQTIKLQQRTYKLHGVVANIPEWDGERVIDWLRERCGKSEEVHSVLKSDMAGGKLPSQLFGANAAWWWICVLAVNLNAAMKRLVLGGPWVTKRMKALRHSLIGLPGRLIEHARELALRLSPSHPALAWLIDIRGRILALAPVPTG